MVLSAAGKAYKASVANQSALVKPLDGEVAITWRWFRARKSGDLDNRSKPLKDALQGIAYHNDSQVVEEHAYRHEDKRDPRVEVTVTRLTPER
jgi:Holliday junction resolvase RusA-like endonuclease